MADIFISYKRGADEPKVEAIVGGLRANGFSVWWDRDIPAGAPWEETIHAELVGARLVIVCWSKDAVDSENVRSEARAAKEQNRLLQLFVGPCQPPLFFGEHQGLKIEEVADVYSPRFEAVLSAVRERIGGDSAPKKLRRNDPAVRAWRRNEPRASWEPLQFGLTFSVACMAVLVLWMSGIVVSLAQFSRLLCLLAIATFFSGWVAYALIVRAPRRVGFLRGTILAVFAGAAAAATILVYDAVTRAIVGAFADNPLAQADAEEAFRLLSGPFSQAQSIGFLTLIGFLSGSLATRIWLPVFVVGVRPLLRSRWPRLGAAALASLTPAFMIYAPFAPGADTRERREQNHDFVVAVAERGLETLDEARTRAKDPLGRAAPATIRRINQMLGFGDSDELFDSADFALRDGQTRVPVKTEWVLAADGSGDATTMQEVLARSVGDITIIVRPGVYAAESDWSDPGREANAPLPMRYRDKWRGREPEPEIKVGPLYAATRAVQESRTHRLVILGEPGAVFDETRHVHITAGLRLEGVTLRFRNPGDITYVPLSPTLRVGPSVTLDSVRIEVLNGDASAAVAAYAHALTTTSAGVDRGAIPLGAAFTGSRETDATISDALGPTQLRNLTIATIGSPLPVGVVLEHGATARVLGAKFEGAIEGPCIAVEATRDILIRNSDLRACSSGNAIRALAPNSNLILDNAGARSVPVLERGADADFYRY